MPEKGNRLQLKDFKPGKERFLADVLYGLQQTQKELPCKYFYDKWGSRLFELICSLNEYYIPRTEAAIMNKYIGEIAEMVGPWALVVEYGSGDCQKVRFLLDHLQEPVAYVPIDISREQLLHVTEDLSSSYTTLELLPVCADYTSRFALPIPKQEYKRVLIYFPGSTIGNFDPIPAQQFLEHMADICRPDGALLIGVDLKKDPEVLRKAYNDSQGVTAAFNLNILHRINHELGGDFQVDAFQHHAFYNPEAGRVEMHLLSRKEQSVHLDNMTIRFKKGESIWTESSYKYDLDEFAELAATAGFKVARVWTDAQQWFSVQYLVTA